MSKEDKKAKSVDGAKRKTKKHLTSSALSSQLANTQSVSGNNLAMPALTEAEQKRIQEMLVHAQLEFNKLKTSIVREKKKEIEVLDQQIKEFVGPFMLIGYDLANNPIEMVSAATPAEQDALLERLRRVMFKINQNMANSNGADPYGFNSN